MMRAEEKNSNGMYEFEGNEFKTKRELRNAIAMSYLSEEGQDKLVGMINKAIDNIISKAHIDGDSDEEITKKANRMINIGFRNTQQKKLNQNLTDTAESLTEKGYVELVIFSYGAGGSVVSNGREVLLRKDFNEKGILVIGHLLAEGTSEVAEAKEVVITQQEEGTVNSIISDDVDVTD